ncbi:Cochaperone protein [Tilletia horrida]|uniref:Cochaperone protein n=1 Tax=Tilletia horrida TaxID=155126 RepID=A0AAN6G889_9BASI|nr:Cochaperone protein [Tilletia horrida]
MDTRIDFYQTDTHVHVSLYARGIRPDSARFTPEERGFLFSAHADWQGSNTGAGAGGPVGPDSQQPPDDSNLFVLRRNLFAQIDPARSTYTVRPTKAELHLVKAQAGLHWPRLQNEAGLEGDGGSAAAPDAHPSASSSSSNAAASGATTVIPTPAPMSNTSILPADAPVRKKNKWESFKIEDDEEDGEAVKAKAEGSSAGAGSSDGARGGGGDVNDFFKQLYAGASDDARRAMIKSFQESNGTTLSMNWDEVKKGKVETRPPDSMVARKYGE